MKKSMYVFKNRKYFRTSEALQKKNIFLSNMHYLVIYLRCQRITLFSVFFITVEFIFPLRVATYRITRIDHMSSVSINQTRSTSWVNIPSSRSSLLKYFMHFKTLWIKKISVFIHACMSGLSCVQHFSTWVARASFKCIEDLRKEYFFIILIYTSFSWNIFQISIGALMVQIYTFFLFWILILQIMKGILN